RKGSPGEGRPNARSDHGRPAKAGMNYRVIWSAAAEDELAAGWPAAVDRAAVSRAAYDLERRLRGNPMADSESRFDDRRIMIVTPLVAPYRVDEVLRTVFLLRVRVPGRH